MVLVSAEHIHKTYGDKPVLQDVSLFIHQADKIGIIGVNGTGKSTLLNIITGQETPDSGNLLFSKDVKLSWLPQNPAYLENVSIEEQIDLDLKGKDITLRYEIHKVLHQLGITDLSSSITTLSGGEKKKVALALALVLPCDVLLLDEPTNHLDMDSILWLEEYLRNYKGAFAMITHDRYFLDSVVGVIVEIRSGQLFTYETNFTGYMERKAQEEESLLASQRKNKSLFRKELEWMKQGAKARGTKSKERIARFEELEQRVSSEQDKKLELSSFSSRLGRQIIEIEHLSHGFGDRVILRDFSYTVLRGDRIGIVGENGSGKTTLFRLIAGELTPDSGSVVHGATVKIGYYSQEHDDIHTKQSMRVIDYLKETAEIIHTPEGTITAGQMLERFLFSPEAQYTPIGRLSGGEQKRLFLIKLLMDAPNVLLLDEPTNDLDITTLQIFEDYLEHFAGAVLSISHDRYFLDKTVDSIFAFEGDGQIKAYTGGYSDYLEKRQLPTETLSPPSKEKEKRQSMRTLKFSYNEQRDFETIDDDLLELESKVIACDEGIIKESSNFQLLEELLEKKDRLEEELLEKMIYGEYLHALALEIEENKNQS